jgi:hypothetical protein
MPDMDKGQIIKLSIAGLAGLAAILLLLVNLGVFSFDKAPPPPPPITEGMTDAEKKEFEKTQAEREKLDKIRAPAGA